jgi:hypothetical protein
MQKLLIVFVNKTWYYVIMNFAKLRIGDLKMTNKLLS